MNKKKKKNLEVRGHVLVELFMAIHWREKGKLQKYLSQDGQYCSQDSNQTPPEYKLTIIA
jgi:hypothetical protein